MIINRNGTEPQIIEQPAQPTISPEEDPEEIYRERGERFKATFDTETLVWNSRARGT